MDIENSTDEPTNHNYDSNDYNNQESPSSQEPEKKKRFTVFTYLVIGIWVIALGGVISIYLVFSGIANNYSNWYGSLPDFKVLENPSSELSSELYSADSILLGKYYRSNRTRIAYEDISPNMLNSLMATEDIRFFKHSGIDLRGTFAIMWYLAQGDRRGSSTITQQLAKNLFSTRSKRYEGKLSDVSGVSTVVMKLKEWMTAVRLEKAYTKKEIISMYLNTVDFGSNSFGIEVASKTFFGKDQKQLKIQEAAMLTGLLKAPTTYSPVLNPDNALRRRNTVLQQLKKYKYISAAKYDSLKAQEIELAYNVENHAKGSATYFRQEVGKYLRRWCKENNYDLYGDGLRIYTTLDSRMQRYAEQAVDSHMTYLQKEFFKAWKGRNPWTEDQGYYFKEKKGYIEYHLKKTEAYKNYKAKYTDQPDSLKYYLNKKKRMKVFSWGGDIDTLLSTIDSLKYYKHFLHTGFMSMDPHSGEIKAWVGGINFRHFKYDHVQFGTRQPGSTFKPIVYSAILGESGGVFTPCTKAIDAPVTFTTGDPEKPTWTPHNADGKYTGDTMTLRQAMGRSVNSITAYMMKTMGDQTPQMVYNYARKLGITTPLEAVPAMCLGTNDVCVYDMVGAYSTFANQGKWVQPYFIAKIEDKYGNVIANFAKKERYVMSPELAYTMIEMLKGSTEESGGTSRRLGYRYGLLEDNEIGAKTGTTQNYADGWFMGVTKDLVSGAWVGAEDKSVHFPSIKMGQGAEMALPIWALYMQKIYADTSLHYEKGNFEKPNGDLSALMECGYLSKPKSEEDDILNDLDLDMPVKDDFDVEENLQLELLYGDDEEDDLQ